MGLTTTPEFSGALRFLFYSHDGMGLGHTQRHLAVATALSELAPNASILLATSAEEVVRLALSPRIEVLKLPGLRKVANGQYSSRRLQIPANEIRALRANLLLTTVKSYRPDVVLVDKHPFGASGEFKSGLKALRKYGGRAVLGLRDILDEPAQVLAEWKPFRMQRRIAKYYDEVLVYGDRTILDTVVAYQFSAALAGRTRFCGYVIGHRITDAKQKHTSALFLPRAARSRPVVLATTGGGEDGFRLLETFIRASDNAPWQAVVVTGTMTPADELAALEKLAAEHAVTLHNFVPQLSTCFGELDALVCMGGYNTLVEAVSHGVPTVCVPRVAPRTEQLIRAEAFARLGLLQICPPNQLNAEVLREKITVALQASPEELQSRALAVLDFDGARRAAGSLLSLGQTAPVKAAG